VGNSISENDKLSVTNFHDDAETSTDTDGTMNFWDISNIRDVWPLLFSFREFL
jgi:hypothetical protein